MTSPNFRYHPDPVATGSLAPSEAPCLSCGESRGLIYTGPVYAEEDLSDGLCPWCIADGSAHAKFDATFVDSEAFSDSAPPAAVAEILERTPGFNSWQGEYWPCCCSDAAAFRGPAGIQELRAQPDLEGLVMSHIVYEMGVSGASANRLLQALSRDAGPTAYVFQCLKCHQYLFHIDQP
jgi:uncharacterized protein CbrC (UPF0167 family)